MVIACLILVMTDVQAADNQEYRYMDNLALQAGTDKSSSFHNYTEVYSQLFSSLKDKPIKFLEIGIYKGDSVKLWEKYFPKAELHFIDIEPNYIQYTSSRAHYHFLDQANSKAVKSFAKAVGGEFDVIIDDGGHQMKQQMVSFQALFPYLKSGGLYVIEDLHTSYWKHFGGFGDTKNPVAGPGTTIHFLKNLVEDLNYAGAVTECADDHKVPSTLRINLNYYQENIHSITFFRSLCIIQKK